VSALRAVVARICYGLVTRAPPSAVARARFSRRLGPVLEVCFAALGSPLFGRVVPVARGRAAGLRLVAERRSLVWLAGSVEHDVQAAFAAHVTSGRTIIDAGASVGFFSLLGARLVGPTGRVVAFEPQPAAARSIRRNAELNGFENVIVVEAALSSRTGRAFLENVGQATARVAFCEPPASRTLAVPCVALDDYLRERPHLRPDLIKIDVEGSEADVLDGMRATLAGHRPVVVVECHDHSIAIASRLERAGYAVSAVSSRGGDCVHSQAHLVAIPLSHSVAGVATP
jgi:FkbM family methyltransferase